MVCSRTNNELMMPSKRKIDDADGSHQAKKNKKPIATSSTQTGPSAIFRVPANFLVPANRLVPAAPNATDSALIFANAVEQERERAAEQGARREQVQNLEVVRPRPNRNDGPEQAEREIAVRNCYLESSEPEEIPRHLRQFHLPIAQRLLELIGGIPPKELRLRWYEPMMQFIDREKFQKLSPELREIIEMNKEPLAGGKTIGSHSFTMDEIHLASQAICCLLCPERYSNFETKFIFRGFIESLFVTSFYFDPPKMLEVLEGAMKLIETVAGQGHLAFKLLKNDYNAQKSEVMDISPSDYMQKLTPIVNGLIEVEIAEEVKAQYRSAIKGMPAALSRATSSFVLLGKNMKNRSNVSWIEYMDFTTPN